MLICYVNKKQFGISTCNLTMLIVYNLSHQEMTELLNYIKVSGILLMYLLQKKDNTHFHLDRTQLLQNSSISNQNSRNSRVRVQVPVPSCCFCESKENGTGKIQQNAPGRGIMLGCKVLS